MKRLRIYADTSVFGGCFDKEFETASRKFFAEVRGGRFTLVVSETLLAELAAAPVRVTSVLGNVEPEHVEEIALTEEMIALRDRYLAAGVVGVACREDAEHIAIASVAAVDMVVSWNFKHIVHFEKIAGFNAINLMGGYRPLQIFSPMEVVDP